MKSVLPVIPPQGISSISLTVGSSPIPITVIVQNQSNSPVLWQMVAAKLGELASTTISARSTPPEHTYDC
jgi:hypothetical protein